MSLEQYLGSLADEFGYNGRAPFSFRFPEITARWTPTYNPDCVWFIGEPIEQNIFAIFEIDRKPSRKHRVGSAALANVVALRRSKRLLYFAITRPQHARVATASIELLRRYLEGHWTLDSTVIASLDPEEVRERIRNSLAR